VHPEVIKKYQENNFEVGLESASDANEKAFFDQVTAAKQTVKKQIVKIIRLKKEGTEYFYWHEELTSKNYLGNKIHCYRVQGKYEDPEFNRQINPKTGTPMAVEIESTETKYEYKWPSDWTPELEELVSESVDLLVVTLGRKYGGFNFQDFKDKSFDDLVTFGKYGTFNLATVKEIQKRNAKQT
jgi:hypothetical protein